MPMTLASEFAKATASLGRRPENAPPELSEAHDRSLFYSGVAAAFLLLEERFTAKDPDESDAEEALVALMDAMREVSAEIVVDMSMATLSQGLQLANLIRRKDPDHG